MRSCYDPLLDEMIFQIINDNDETRFNTLVEILDKNPRTIRKHLDFLVYDKELLIWTRNKPGHSGSIKLSPTTKEKRQMDLFTIDYSDKKGICKEWKEQHKKINFRNLNKIEKKEIGCILLLSHISEGSSINIPSTVDPITEDVISFTFENLEDFRISELLHRNRKISSINEIREVFSKLGPSMENYIFTQYYNQLMYTKNWFLDLQLSKQEIEECLKLLEDEKYPIIRKTRYEDGDEMWYRIDSGDKEMYDVDEDKNNNITFILACTDIFRFVFIRMSLFLMFKKQNDDYKKYRKWLEYIYGETMTCNFLFALKKELKEEYKNRFVEENFKHYFNNSSLTSRQKERFIEKKIRIQANNSIKYYDNLIKENLFGREKDKEEKKGLIQKYAQKIKPRNRVFYDLMLKIIYPSFLRKEYEIKK